MSPNNKKKLAIIRKKLDLLDNRFFKLIKIRTKLVNEVLMLKQFKNEIVDKKRINQILNNIRKKSYSNKIDSKITLKIWKNMIQAYINFEKKNFKKK